MRIAVLALLAAGFIVFEATDAAAQNNRLCPGLSGRERTRCLERERDRAAEESAYWDRQIAQLDRQIELVCATRDISRAGGARVSVPYNAGAAVGDAALGQRRTCEEARERRRDAQRRARETRRR